MPDRSFDRRPHYDERSRDWPVTAVLPRLAPRSFTWSCRGVLDQGREGACVGFGWAGELLARPAVVADVDNALALRIYHQAQTLDDTPGENYEGTSVIAGAKAVRQRGFMAEYRWAFNVEDVLLTLGYHGPVVLGVNWREGMYDPDAEGWVHATGKVVGGHCIMARGVNVTHRGVLLQNSWGIEWGMNGCAHLSWDDLGVLLADQGEACVPVGRDRIGSLA